MYDTHGFVWSRLFSIGRKDDNDTCFFSEPSHAHLVLAYAANSYMLELKYNE